VPLKNHIPNFLTSCNLFLGGLAVIEIFQGDLENVIFYTLLAAVIDFLDGFAARLLGAHSNIGKDLDSLADMISFGLVPSLLMYKILYDLQYNDWWIYTTLSIAVLSGVRLAKFNNDTRQTEHFHGLPTPANAMFICSLPLLAQQTFFSSILTNQIILISISILMALLLVSDFKLIALKFKGYKWSGNESKYLLILGSLVLIATFQWIALPFVIVLYIIVSILANIISSIK